MRMQDEENDSGVCAIVRRALLTRSQNDPEENEEE